MNQIIFVSTFLLVTSSAFAQNEKSAAIEQEIKKLSNDWMTAAMNRDEKTLNKIVATTFRLGGTDLDNPGISREVWMKNTMENLVIDSIHYIRMRVDVTDHVAIVQSELYWSVAFLDMPVKKDTVNLIDTWIKRGRAWQVVSRLVVD